jgi:hypothetical protein
MEVMKLGSVSASISCAMVSEGGGVGGAMGCVVVSGGSSVSMGSGGCVLVDEASFCSDVVIAGGKGSV